MTAFESRPFRFRSEAPQQVLLPLGSRLTLPCPIGGCGTYVFGATAAEVTARLARHKRCTHPGVS
ncbi:hypothetical protein [Kibdelosporangium philippinense]|uniref:hypothetical protein n=1 Tax=Kibdelosporangium philippinense TaxID=211113 RepID=UPI003609BADC